MIKWLDLSKVHLISNAAVMFMVYAGIGLFVAMLIFGGIIWFSIMRKDK